MIKNLTRWGLCLSLFISFSTFSQEHQLPVLSGKVIDAQSGEVIVGA
ncbi:MAG: hypothetical protein RLZZ185_1442, partial [Bacteroidota bacterium]